MKYTIAPLLAAFILSLPTLAFAYGEGENIPMVARAVHLLTNAARADTNAALRDCGKNCLPDEHYLASMPPLYWSGCLEKSSQMYANLTGPYECPDHDSPCTIKKSIYKEYPEKCQGQASCTCADKFTCGASFGKYTERIDGFCSSEPFDIYGENILYTHDFYDDAVFLINMWLHEDGYKTPGHRKNILNPKYNLVGHGVYKGALIQDLGHTKKPSPQLITAGASFSDGKNRYIGLHYHHENISVKSAAVHFETQGCYELSLQIGTSKNGLYLINAHDIKSLSQATCTPFVFEVKSAIGTVTRYPSSGSLLYGNCGQKSWSSKSLSSCFEPPKQSYSVDDIPMTIVPAKPFKIENLFSEHKRERQESAQYKTAPNVTKDVVKITSSSPSDGEIVTKTITTTTEVVKVRQCQIVTYDENDNVVGTEIVDCEEYQKQHPEVK